ncbi:MAG: hypothetical protein ACXWXK_07825, partial [Actinomycetota bacterium]
LSQIKPLQPLELPLQEAEGCVLAQDVVAGSDIPDFPSSAMDGFAVRSSEVAPATPSSPVELRIVGRSMIGERPEGTVGGGEIQLTDAITLLAQQQAVYAWVFEGGRFDVGNKLDYLKATIELAIDREDIGEGLRAYLADLVQRKKLL